MEDRIQSMFAYVEAGKEQKLARLIKKSKGVVHAQDAQGRTVRVNIL
jgi:hypothetical protein